MSSGTQFTCFTRSKFPILTPAELLLRGALSNLEALRAKGEHGSKQKEQEKVAEDELGVLALLGKQQHRAIAQDQKKLQVSVVVLLYE
jgi:hypothetical protein